MATGKRYFWIKLREAFMTSDTVDFLMSQKGGANYVVLYQMLCLKTINTGGRLSRQIGEYLIPYDVEKIQRDCKWFSTDTVRVALDLYKKLGLIYEDRDGTYYNVPQENVEYYKRLYPGVDVEQALRNMMGWSMSAGPNRKTRRGIKRFITNWLCGDQDSGKLRPGGNKKASHQPKEYADEDNFY